MVDFPFFKMAAVRHLGFSKVGNFNFRSYSEAQYASSFQISRRSVKPFRRYCRFSIFQDGGRRHLGFWKFQIFNGWDVQEGRTACQISSKSLKPRLRYGIPASWLSSSPLWLSSPLCLSITSSVLSLSFTKPCLLVSPPELLPSLGPFLLNYQVFMPPSPDICSLLSVCLSAAFVLLS